MEYVVNATLLPPYPRERDLVLTVQEAASASKPLWLGAENVAPHQDSTPRTIQPVASLSTACAIWAHCRTERVSIRLLLMPRVRMHGALSEVLVALCLGIIIS